MYYLVEQYSHISTYHVYCEIVRIYSGRDENCKFI